MTRIALIVLDTLRKDAFDEYFDWLPGIRYENAWSPSGWTVPVHGTLFGGAYPSEVGVYEKTTTLDCEHLVLAEHLSDAGYTTRGFSANANIADAFRFTRGFDEFTHSWRGHGQDPDVVDWSKFISETQEDGPSRYLRAIARCLRRDVDTVRSLSFGVRMKARDLDLKSIAGSDDGAQKALETIGEMSFGDNEFLFLNLMEAHGPYDPPEKYKTVDIETNPSFGHTVDDGPDDDPEDVRQAYNDAVRYLSDVYADIFSELSDGFDYVITVSDHGEMFGEDGVWGHSHGLYPELTHVPLSIYAGEDDVERRDETVGLLDIYRTVLAAAGIDDDSARGRDLLSDRSSRRYLMERHGLKKDRLAQLRNEGYDERTIRSYDESYVGAVTANGGYGCETRNGFVTWGPGDEPTIRAAIEEMQVGLDPTDVDLGAEKDVPLDVEKRLAKLGYK